MSKYFVNVSMIFRSNFAEQINNVFLENRFSANVILAFQ